MSLKTLEKGIIIAKKDNIQSIVHEPEQKQYRITTTELGELVMDLEEFFTKDGGYTLVDGMPSKTALVISTERETLTEHTMKCFKEEFDTLLRALDNPGEQIP